MSTNPWQNFGDSKNNNQNNQHNNDEDYFVKIADRFIKFFQNNFQRNVVIIILGAVVTTWCFTGFVVVSPEEKAVVTTFGKYSRILDSGLHYKLPWPIQSVQIETVARVRTIKIGSDDAATQIAKKKGESTARLQQSLMLTGDENIVDMQFEVQWTISDLRSYFFNIANPINTIGNVSHSVIREIVAKIPLAKILTDGRLAIETEAKAEIQQILNDYQSGIEIALVQMLKADPPQQVIDAFRDVQNARVDRESIINRAEAYRNDVIPKIRGEAEATVQQANGYANETVSIALGKAKRFDDIYKQYKNAKFVTRKRIYLETMEGILSKTNKTIVDENLKNFGAVVPNNLVNSQASNINTAVNNQTNATAK
jgi:membrane protease subunit HflK